MKCTYYKPIISLSINVWINSRVMKVGKEFSDAQQVYLSIANIHDFQRKLDEYGVKPSGDAPVVAIEGPAGSKYPMKETFRWVHQAILAIANTKKIPGCYVSRCYVGLCGGNIVSGAWAGVTGEACTYVYLYWFTFIIVRPAQWQPRKNDPLDYWSQLNVNWKLGNDVSAKIKPRKCGTGTCTICGNHAR